jgi:hypothetical protein
MTESEKQKRIRLLYEDFAKMLPELSTKDFAVWEDTPNDPPDINVNNGELGIEFVDFIRGWQEKGGSPIRAAEKIYDSIAEQAQQIFERENPSIKLSVSFHWQDYDPANRPKQSETPKLINSIVDLINQALATKQARTFELEWEDFEKTPLETKLSSVDIRIYPDGDFGWWRSGQSGWGRVEAVSFQELIKMKENDLPRYATKFKSCWLIIVADHSAISSTAFPGKAVKPGCVISKFDRVYFFNSFLNRVFQLTKSNAQE